ncbi:hypothetical protein Tco_1388574, partial [Tanacetum coccineum]
EDPKEDLEEDSADYPADGGDDDDESSDDDDEQEASKDDDEEEEHPAPVDSSAIPVDDPVPSAEDTEAFETNESAPTPIPPPPLPLPSPPTHTIPTYDEASLGYRAAEIRLSAASPPIHHPSEIPSPPLFEVGKSSIAAARQSGFEVATVDVTAARPMSKEVGYRIEDVWDDMVGDMEERAPTIEDLSQRVTNLATTLARDTHEIYIRDTRIGSLKTLVATLVAQTSSLQTQLTTTLGRIQTLKAGEPEHARDPKP